MQGRPSSSYGLARTARAGTGDGAGVALAAGGGARPPVPQYTLSLMPFVWSVWVADVRRSVVLFGFCCSRCLRRILRRARCAGAPAARPREAPRMRASTSATPRGAGNRCPRELAQTRARAGTTSLSCRCSAVVCWVCQGGSSRRGCRLWESLMAGSSSTRRNSARKSAPKARIWTTFRCSGAGLGCGAASRGPYATRRIGPAWAGSRCTQPPRWKRPCASDHALARLSMSRSAPQLPTVASAGPRAPSTARSAAPSVDLGPPASDLTRTTAWRMRCSGAKRAHTFCEESGF